MVNFINLKCTKTKANANVVRKSKVVKIQDIIDTKVLFQFQVLI